MEPTGRFSKVSAGKSKSQKKKSQGWKIKRMMEKCFFLISDCFNVVLLNSFLWLTSQCSLSSHFIQFHAPTSLHFLLFFVFASFGLNCKCVRVVILKGGGVSVPYRAFLFWFSFRTLRNTSLLRLLSPPLPSGGNSGEGGSRGDWLWLDNPKESKDTPVSRRPSDPLSGSMVRWLPLRRKKEVQTCS